MFIQPPSDARVREGAEEMKMAICVNNIHPGKISLVRGCSRAVVWMCVCESVHLSVLWAN